MAASVRVAAAVAAMCSAGETETAWVPVPERWETTYAIVLPANRTAMLRTPTVNLATIQTGALTSDSQLFAQFGDPNDPDLATAFKFHIESAVQGEKARLELTDCFVTPADLVRHGVDPTSKLAAEFEAIRFVYQNCSGAATAPAADVATEMTVSYSVQLPVDFPRASQAIIGQFHGRPDPRIFVAPNGTVVRMSTDQAYAACTAGTCFDGNISGGRFDGWHYKQGGYPPLTFGITSSNDASQPVWAVVARSDDRIYIPKADCGFNPQKDYWPDGVQCPGGVHEQVRGVWRANFSALPLGQWVDFSWRVTWSRYAKEGGARLSDGVISLLIDGGAVANVSWHGPLGRHDDGRQPFFKIGVYDPSGNTAPIDLMVKNLTQSFRVLALAPHFA